MRAVRVIGGVATVVDVPKPQGDGVRVRVDSVGICGSDLHLVELGFGQDVTMGHEFAGLTDDGTAVAVEPMLSCGTCVHCERGDDPQCSAGTPTILGIGLDGGLADEVLVPEHLLVALPAGLNTADACLVEPLAVGVRSVGRAGVGPGDRVVVVGGGSIGLCAVAAAVSRGATVELAARHDHQRAAGERLGAGPATDQPADVVVEAAGTETALAEAVDRCVSGGTVAIPGTYWDDVRLPAMALGLKEVSLVPSSMYGAATGPRDVTVAAGLLATEPEIARTLITHRFPLDDAAAAFSAAADRAAGALKVVLEP